MSTRRPVNPGIVIGAFVIIPPLIALAAPCYEEAQSYNPCNLMGDPPQGQCYKFNTTDTCAHHISNQPSGAENLATPVSATCTYRIGTPDPDTGDCINTGTPQQASVQCQSVRGGQCSGGGVE